MRPATRDPAWTAIGAATLVAVVAGGVTAALAVGDRGPDRVRAILFAGLVCLVAGLGGWFAGRLRPSSPARVVAAALAAVGIRFFPALLAVAWLQSAAGGLAGHGAGEWLLVFYLAVLATDILLHIMGARRDRGTAPEN